MNLFVIIIYGNEFERAERCVPLEGEIKKRLNLSNEINVKLVIKIKLNMACLGRLGIP